MKSTDSQNNPMQPMYAIGIDIGGTSTKIARVNPQGAVLDVRTLPTDGSYGADAFIHSMLGKTQELINSAPHEMKVTGIGLAVAGFIDADHTRMVFNPNITWLQGFPLRETIVNHFGLATTVEIDSNAAVLSESLFGIGAGCERFFVLSIGTGVGGGMVINGKLLRFTNECLGDIGHVMVDPGGLECASGCKGCAEAVISASGLEHLTQQLGPSYPYSILQTFFQSGSLPDTHQIIDAAKGGDPLALVVLHKVGYWLGIALANITPVFAPERIAIAGGVSSAGSLLLDSADMTYRSICGNAYTHHVEIKIAKLGWQAGVVGAASPFLQLGKEVIQN